MTIENIILVSAIFFGFLAHSFTGFAAGAVALPMLVLVFPLRDSVVIISVFLFIMNLILAIKNWQFIDKKILLRIGGFSIVGVGLGAATLGCFDHPEILVRFLGVFIVLNTIHKFFNSKQIDFFKNRNAACGLIGGFFSGLYSVGGPFFAFYLFNMLDDARVLRATMFMVLLMLTTTRLFSLWNLGLITYPLLETSAIGFIGFIPALFLGDMLHEKVNDAIFKKIFLTFLFVCGLVLMFK